MESSKNNNNDLNAASKTNTDLQLKLNTLDNLIKLRSKAMNKDNKSDEAEDADEEDLLPGFRGIF